MPAGFQARLHRFPRYFHPKPPPHNPRALRDLWVMSRPSQNAMVNFAQTYRGHGLMGLQSTHYQARAQGLERRRAEE